jgi:hypothetical protein
MPKMLLIILTQLFNTLKLVIITSATTQSVLAEMTDMHTLSMLNLAFHYFGFFGASCSPF